MSQKPNEALGEMLSFEVDVENMQETASAIVFPIKVYDDRKRPVRLHTVTLRPEFYSELMALPDGSQQLFRILSNRVKDEMARARVVSPVTIQDKLQLMTGPVDLDSL